MSRSSDELERAAEEVLPPEVYGFVAGGADDELSLRRNHGAFESWSLVPKVLARSGSPDSTTTLLGSALMAPVVVAPMGMQQLVHPDGELATAAAARTVGLGFTVASGSSVALEAVAEVAGQPRWFQLYLMKDRAVSKDLVHRAVASGYTGIVLTVDVPVIGDRPRDHRSRFAAPPGVRNANFEPYRSIDAGHHAYVTDIECDLGWEDLDWLVDAAGDVPVLLKGVLRGEDAARAVRHGAAGVVVSNHGGRQLGRAPAPLDVLPSVVDAVAGSALVLMDGGVRSGADVVTAVGFGADAVLVGRLVMWALAVGGQDRVAATLQQLVQQVQRTMTLLGAQRLSDLADCVRTAGAAHPPSR